jgi:hypothetical protein
MVLAPLRRLRLKCAELPDLVGQNRLVCFASDWRNISRIILMICSLARARIICLGLTDDGSKGARGVPPSGSS